MDKKIKGVFVAMLISGLLFCGCTRAKKEQVSKKADTVLTSYIDYLESVYDIMNREYYANVSREVFNQYISDFKTKIFEKQVQDKTKLDDGIKHIATGILVSRLKSPDDPFTNFYPPQLVKDFKSSVLGFGLDIGIEGVIKEGSFIISQVEPRSDAFKKGISIGNEVIKIDDVVVSELSLDQIKQKFSPEEGKEVALEVFFPKTNATSAIKVTSTKYFKQSVFAVPTLNPKVACLKIKFFNEETGNDLKDSIEDINKNNITKLILDLRDNAGGPPLAAWDISGVFLAPKQNLFYFAKKNQTPQGLVSSPSVVHYEGKVAILINKGTGSASELFSGIMQAYHRASLIGENSAGKVYLKSLFDLSDGATLELTVAKGFLFNNNPVDAGGLTPNFKIPDNDNLLKAAVDLIDKVS